MPLASRPNLALKSKQDINPSIDRNTEATAQDFADYNAILEDHANLIDDLSKAYAAATFYGIRGSLALFQAEFSDAVEGYGVIDPGNGNPQIIAEVTNGVWTATANVAPIQRFNTKLDLPQPGIEDVIYVVKDEKILSLWYDGSYKDFGKDGYNGKSTYQIALDFGFVGTEPQWLISMKGASAYQSALDNGFAETEAAWLISLEGIAGKSAYEVAVDEGFVGTQADWVVSLGGIPGKSAYEVSLDQGFVGTEAEWIASIEGVEGKSAYEVAVAGGFVGTQAEWLISIEGLDGEPGPIGKSNYQLWLDAGNVGTFQDYQDTLKGEPGPAGEGNFKTDLEASNAKATPIDADIFGYLNSADSNVLVKFTWANIKAALKNYFDTLYATKYGTRAVLAAAEIDWADGVDVYTKTITGPLVLTEINLPQGDNVFIKKLIVNGNHPATMPGAHYVWKGGVADGVSDAYVFDCINGNAGSLRVEYTITPNA